jgi:hypothetical protein
VSFVVGLLLVLASAKTASGDLIRTPRDTIEPVLTPFSIFLLASLAAGALLAGWWSFVRGPDLLTRTDNPRRALDDRYVYRGALLGRGDIGLAETRGTSGDFSRTYTYPALGPVLGYNNPVYGQSGLEASLDPILRGLEGNDTALVWWHHLLYGQPPPGLDVRLTLDMDLQRRADGLLSGHSGALILLNAESGEILVMASHPSFNPNQLDETWDDLIQDPQAPLVNRATQGSYPTGELAELPFMQAAADSEIQRVNLRLPLAETVFPEEATPIEVAFGAASLSNGGQRPAARLALSYLHPDQGWQILQLLGTPIALIKPADASLLNRNMVSADWPIWEISTIPDDEALTWYLGGTFSGESPSLTLVLVLEEENLLLAEEIGREILVEGINR